MNEEVLNDKSPFRWKRRSALPSPFAREEKRMVMAESVSLSFLILCRFLLHLLFVWSQSSLREGRKIIRGTHMKRDSPEESRNCLCFVSRPYPAIRQLGYNFVGCLCSYLIREWNTTAYACWWWWRRWWDPNERKSSDACMIFAGHNLRCYSDRVGQQKVCASSCTLPLFPMDTVVVVC